MQCLISNYNQHPWMDDQVRENRHNIQGVIIVIPCSTSQRESSESSGACYVSCWLEILLQICV